MTTTTNIPDKFMTAQEVAEIFGVSRRSVYDYKKNRGLKHTQVGGAIRFTKYQVEHWLEKNSQDAA